MQIHKGKRKKIHLSLYTNFFLEQKTKKLPHCCTHTQHCYLYESQT